MIAGGLPLPASDHAVHIANLALDMKQALLDFNKANTQNLDIRIGIHPGHVVAGVIRLS